MSELKILETRLALIEKELKEAKAEMILLAKQMNYFKIIAYKYDPFLYEDNGYES